MEAKDKAKALVDKFLPFMHPFHDVVALKQAKQCALIACKEIIQLGCIEVPYWLDVENEINQL